MKYEVKKMRSKISDNHNKQSCSKVNFVDTGEEFELRRLYIQCHFILTLLKQPDMVCQVSPLPLKSRPALSPSKIQQPSEAAEHPPQSYKNINTKKAWYKLATTVKGIQKLASLCTKQSQILQRNINFSFVCSSGYIQHTAESIKNLLE